MDEALSAAICPPTPHTSPRECAGHQAEDARGGWRNKRCPARAFAFTFLPCPWELPRVPPQLGYPYTEVTAAGFLKLIIRAVVAALGLSRNLKVWQVLDFR